MKYEGFSVKLSVETGKIKLGKIKNGSLPVTLLSKGKVVGKIDLDVAGMLCTFRENVQCLETGARGGNRIVAFEAEVSTSLISSNYECYGTLKLQAPKQFWKDRMKRLTGAVGHDVYRGVVEIRSKVKNGHFWRFSSSSLDLLVAESVNFQRVDFPKVREMFEKYCRAVNAFFTEEAEFPQPMTVHDSVKDFRGEKVDITVTFSLNERLLDSRSELIRAHNDWFREAGEIRPERPERKIPEDSTSGQQGIILVPK